MTLALRDTVLTWLPHWLGFTLRCLNIVLAIWTAIFATVAASRVTDRLQRARFHGLALLTATFAWGTLFRLNAELTIQVPFFTAALALSAYGSLGYLRSPR